MSDEAAPIEITYQLTDADLYELVMHSKSPRFGLSGRTIVKVIMAGLATFFGVIVFALPDILGTSDDDPSRLGMQVGIASMGLIFVVFYPAYARWYTRRASLAYQTLPLGLKLVMDDKGIYSELLDQNATTGWKLVQRSVETDSHFLLYLSRMRGYIIPKAAVGVATELEQLRGLIARHVQKAEKA